jgi:hypothetical protein
VSAIIIPVTVRNYVVSKDIVFVSWQGGFNFYLGNNRAANGWSARAPGIDASWRGPIKESISIAEMDLKRRLSRSEVSDYWYGRAWSDIKSDPSGFISLLFKKARLVLNGFEIPNNQDIYHARSFAPIIKPFLYSNLLYFPYGILAPLALIGILLSFKRWREFLLLYLYLGAYTASILAFFVCARFRQPLIPVLILFAAYAVYQLIKQIRVRQAGWILLIAPLFALLMLEANHRIIEITHKQLEAVSHFTLGNAYRDQKNFVLARAEYELAFQADPSNVYALINIGSTLQEQNNIDEAIGCYQRAIDINPYIYNSYLNLGNIMMRQRDFQKAVAVLEKGCRMIPNNDILLFELAKGYYNLNRLDDTRKALDRGLQLNPDNSSAQRFYQQIMRRLNQ